MLEGMEFVTLAVTGYTENPYIGEW